MQRWTPAMALLLIITAAGCGPLDPSPAVSATDSMTPVASPAVAGSTAPASSDVVELEATGEPLPPGRYSRSGFEPPITIELDGSWQAVQLFDGFFDVQDHPGSPDVVAVQFARVTGVFGAEGVIEPANAAEAADVLADYTSLRVVETSASQIGGLDGSQITVENAGSAHTSVIEVPPGPLGIDPGRRLWIAFFDTDAGLLAIMVGGSTEGWEEALGAAEPVLESVEIGS